MSDSTIEGPIWLDMDYVRKVIRKYVNNQTAEIKTFTTSLATTKGENYFSALYLLNVAYTAEMGTEEVLECSFIIKTRVESELITQLEEDFDVFVREAQYYTVLNEEANCLLVGINDRTLFGPKAIYVDEKIIVMENLRLRGYNIKDVKQGLDYKECHLVLQKLAKFHAISMVLYKKNPDMFRYHLPGNITEHPSPMHTMYCNAIQNTIEYCKQDDGLNRYVPKLEVFSDTIIAKMINVYSRNTTDRFQVLNHGDLWVNNLMFHQQDADILFIDYQEGFFGSPGIDLNYFIFSSWQPYVFQNHFEDLIFIYHETLCDVLQKLSYQQRMPTVDDVKKEIQNKGFHGLATATCLLPILINENADLADPENFVLETEKAIQCRRKIFQNPKYGKRLKLFLKYFEDVKIL